MLSAVYANNHFACEILLPTLLDVVKGVEHKSGQKDGAINGLTFSSLFDDEYTSANITSTSTNSTLCVGFHKLETPNIDTATSDPLEFAKMCTFINSEFDLHDGNAPMQFNEFIERKDNAIEITIVIVAGDGAKYVHKAAVCKHCFKPIALGCSSVFWETPCCFRLPGSNDAPVARLAGQTNGDFMDYAGGAPLCGDEMLIDYIPMLGENTTLVAMATPDENDLDE